MNVGAAHTYADGYSPLRLLDRLGIKWRHSGGVFRGEGGIIVTFWRHDLLSHDAPPPKD